MFSASLRTLSKTNPTIINEKTHVANADCAWSLSDGDKFTVGERSFRFEFMQSASSNSENFSQNSLSKPVSSKKKRPSLNSGSSKKIKRGVPTPLRQEIAARRITTPVAPSAGGGGATASNTMAPPAPLSVHKSQRKKKKKKRTLPTPLRGEISARRVATPAKEKEALLDHVAQVEEMVQVRSSKKQKRGLPTPIRNAIGSRLVHTPAAAAATATAAALPTPLRTAID